ncbi:MAG: PHP domain-containing protein [Cellvibrionaceae bacterium]|nr:PHP domain-containing protein [Cellvibrionaceae bacterium]MCV6625817.1 PHP domain-containing protein [Cellvibrionaceae bacterium]
MLYDLHCHSHYSDGILSPSELVSRAVEHSVDILALTDHDTVAGLAEARQAASEQGLDLINGIEFSCQWAGRGVHIVGLGIDPQSAVMQQAVAEQAERRWQRCEMIADKLHKLGFQGALAGVQKLVDKGTIGRPHFAQYLLQQGHVSSINQAFKKYLGAGKPGDIKNLWPEIGQVVEWIRGSGGQAVLAHPDKYKLTRTKLRRLCDDFSEAGGAAMELISGKQPPGVAETMAQIAQQCGLLASRGSDFHQPGQPWQELGCGGPLPPGVEPVWAAWS